MTERGRIEILPDLVRHHAREHPGSIAVVEGLSTWSWARLDRQADAIAAAMTANDIEPGGRVGLWSSGSALGIAALSGIARAGVSIVLVNPRLTVPEIRGLLAAADCRILVTDATEPSLADPDIALIRLDQVRQADGNEPSPDDAGTDDAGPDGAATTEYIVPTSGSTARPKLARLPRDRLAASARAWNEVLPPATGWLLSLGLAHVAGLGIVSRATASMVPIVIPEEPGTDGLIRAVETADANGIALSHLSLVASQLAALLDATDDGSPPSAVRAVILGGGPIPAALVLRATAAGWPVMPSYGMTETASGIVVASPDEAATHPASVGRPLPGVEVRLSAGEVEVRGPMLFAGYLDDPGSSGAAVTTDGWLATGDLGRLDADGRLTITGRADGRFISGGENVSPEEVEAAMATHPGVREVAVIGVADATWGHVPIAIIVTDRAVAPTDAELLAHARSRLAGFKVPARIVRVTALPHTALGKIERRSLSALVTQEAISR